jgi:hypothetical protein
MEALSAEMEMLSTQNTRFESFLEGLRSLMEDTFPTDTPVEE